MARASGPDFDRQSDVESDVQDVAVLHLVGLPLEALEVAPRGFGVRSRRDEVVPADHLATNEPTRDVRVDGRRRVQRRSTPAKRPRPRLLLAGREEGQQVELTRQAPDDLL